MKNTKLFSMILFIAVLCSLVAGCANKGENGKTNKKVNNKENSVSSQVNVVSDKKLLDGFKAEKIGTIGKGKRIYATTTNPFSSGVYYKDENGKYGIMSFDGKKDTGAKYTYCESINKYFMVATSDFSAQKNEISAMNCVGLVDLNGQEIIPMKYASIKQINERYYQLYEALGTTDDRDEALIFSSNEVFSSVYPDEDDALFTGKWYIYDIISGKMVKGATGTKPYAFTGHGDFIEYVTDDKQIVIVNQNGDTLPYTNSLVGGVNVFDDGHYTVEEDDSKGSLYNSDGDKLFEYNSEEDYVPMNSVGDYFYASGYDTSTKYVIMDKTGKVISSEFNSIPILYGNLIYVDKKLCDMEGNPIVEGEFERVRFDDVFKNSYLLYNGSEVTCIDIKGNVLYKGVNQESSYYAIKDDSGKYYSFKDKDFTIKGSYCLTSWLVKSEDENYEQCVVDSISGETLLSGYSYLDVAETNDDFVYIYAKKSDGSYDIYTAK